jgi:hypothetical protein
MDAYAFRAASVGSHAITIACDPIRMRFEAICRCGWCENGHISGRSERNVMETVLAHWHGIDQEWGAGES